ncbi:amidohydrolase family-domain-containing protein [Xylaria bambusicola]|uniref:amidohydrolase family-domain-containing protein n=1 Tax=Xylaria bambusicola TaxID=326684 RepID=UPI002007D612|nr:amidohydrolase family-domain-containing protein [Xylaria bambusicola]KAI0505134.1 amidohydrolase family-domain-containing protein [Xylaria bambusicola]
MSGMGYTVLSLDRIKMADLVSISLTKFLFVKALLLLLACHVSSSSSLQGNLILSNGSIHTMSEAEEVVSVVGIKDGLIVYVGDSQAEALSKFLGAPSIVDLQGRTAVPGLIDSHNHIVLLGNRPGYHTPLENAYSIADVQSTYQSRGKGVPQGNFITTIGGFHPNHFAERRLPTLAELDAAAPNHPVFISYSFAGPATTNSLGKAFFESLASPPVISANGSITSGENNGKALLALRKQLTFADRKRGVHDAMMYAVSMGVTTHLDQGAFPKTDTPSDGAANEDLYSMHLPWLSVYDDEEGIIRLRINFLHMDDSTDVSTVQQRLLNTFKFFGSDMVRTGGIGEFITTDYAGGQFFTEGARRVAEAGWRLEVHSLTGTDFQSQIQTFEAINANNSIEDLRWVVAHVPLITPEYLQRLKKIGGGVNLSGWQYLAGNGRAAGPPFRDILESGIPAGIGADGMQIAPLNPWVHAYYATTGKNALGQVINAGQLLSRQELLRLYTRANQWFLGGRDEGLLGSIEVGRLGDVVVLNEDYFSVSDEMLKKLKSVLTVVGGTVVYDESSLASQGVTRR